MGQRFWGVLTERAHACQGGLVPTFIHKFVRVGGEARGCSFRDRRGLDGRIGCESEGKPWLVVNGDQVIGGIRKVGGAPGVLRGSVE